MTNSLVIIGSSAHMQGPQQPKRLIVHGTVSGTYVGGAVDVAHYFQSPNSGGLAHYVVDPNTIVNTCPEKTQCWGDGFNKDEIHLEFCDWVDWDGSNKALVGKYRTPKQFAARWGDDDHVAMMHIAASKAAAICDVYNFPATWLNVAALDKGPEGSQLGVSAHSDISDAWHTSDHHDPGPDFPVGTFMGLVKGYYASRMNSH